MSLPTDFSHDVAERAPQPGFDSVVERAGRARRRRRTTIASGLAAAVVVAGAGFAVGRPGGDDRRPEPAPPAPATPWDGTSAVDPGLPGAVRRLLGRDEIHPWAVVGSGDGIAVLWRTCPGDGADSPCDFVLVTRSGSEVHGTEIAGQVPRLAAVPGGWLVEADGVLTRVGADGGDEPVVDTGTGNTDAMPGDTAVEAGVGSRVLRGTKLVGLRGVEEWQPSSAYVTPGGRLLLAPGVAGPRRVVVTDGDLGWETAHVADPAADSVGTGLLAGNGDHVAYVLLGDAPDGSIPVEHVAVSSDAGETWQVSQELESSIYADPSSLVVSPSGTSYLTTGSHGLVRIDAGANAVLTPLSEHDMQALVVGDEVCVVTEAGPVDRMMCSDDDGTTWAPQPLPGFS